MSGKVEEINEQHERARNARRWMYEEELLEKERDRALKTLDALTNDRAYESEEDHLILHQQVHGIPVEHKVCIGNWLKNACLEARAEAGDAQADATLQAAVCQVDREA